MRKLMVLPLVGLLALGAVGPVAAGSNVSNSSGSGESIYGEWSAEGTYGYVFVGEDSMYGGFGDIYQESGTWAECDPGSDGGFGFVGTRTWGYSDSLTVDISRRLESGHATGSIELYTATVDECAGDYGDDAVSEVVTLDVSVSAAGPLATFRGHGSYKIPSEFNGHENYRGKERAASGTVAAGTSIDATFSSGYMSVVTWSDHING